MSTRITLLTGGVLLLAHPAAAQADPAVGLLRSGDAIVHFDTQQPGTLFSALPVTGVPTAERLVSLDYRYHSADGATGPGLFGLSVDAVGTAIRLYRIDSGTGKATPVGGPVDVPVAGQRFGIDFNPTADRVRVVNEADESVRLNPDTGALVGNDADLKPAGVSVTGVAYDRVDTPPASPAVAANSTLYAIDNAAGSLGTIGGLNQTPTPNGGTFTAIGSLGVTPDVGTHTDFDISRGDIERPNGFGQPVVPLALATITSSGAQRLYTIDLGSGAATAIGPTAAPLASIAALPTVYSSFGTYSGVPTGHGNPYAVSVNEGDAFTALVSRSGDASSTLPVTWVTTQGRTGSFRFEPGERSKELSISTLRDGVGRPGDEGSVRVEPGPVPFVPGSAANFRLVDVDPAPATPVDRTNPTIGFGSVPSSITFRKLTTGKGLEVSTTTNEPVVIDAALLASVSARGLRRKPFAVAVAERSFPLASGTRTISLRPSKEDLRRPKRTLKLKLRVRVVDAAGNSTTKTRTIKVKPR